MLWISFDPLAVAQSVVRSATYPSRAVGPQRVLVCCSDLRYAQQWGELVEETNLVTKSVTSRVAARESARTHSRRVLVKQVCLLHSQRSTIRNIYVEIRHLVP